MTIGQGTLVTLVILIIGIIIHTRINRWFGIAVIYLAGLVGSLGTVSAAISGVVTTVFAWLQNFSA